MSCIRERTQSNNGKAIGTCLYTRLAQTTVILVTHKRYHPKAEKLVAKLFNDGCGEI